MKDKMARTKLTARKSTGGKVPRKQQVKEIVRRPKNVTQPLALITKKFRKIRTYSDILYIAKRIFQKDPSVSYIGTIILVFILIFFRKYVYS